MALDPHSLNDMTGLHALVTGAGTGIGLNIARTYAAHGATVYLVGRRLEKLQEAKASVEKVKTSGKVVLIQGDVSNREGIDKVVEEYKSVSEASHLDVLVANAGIFRLEAESWNTNLDAEGLSKQLTSSTFEDWTETASINTTSFYILTGAFVPLLSKAKDGNVIVTSSIAGVHWSAKTSNPSYAASKVATNHLVKILANRLSSLYIRINAIVGVPFVPFVVIVLTKIV